MRNGVRINIKDQGKAQEIIQMIKKDRKKTNRSVERGTTPKEYKSNDKYIEIKEGWTNIILDKPLKRTRRQKHKYTIYYRIQRNLWRSKYETTNY